MELLLRLMDASGVSGNEEDVRDMISKEIEKYVDKISTDTLGNLIAVKKGKLPKVMLAAHMDEVGLMVKGIKKNGNIKCAGIGDIEIKYLLGKKVKISARCCINGIIKSSKKSKNTSINHIFVKTKSSKKELLKNGVEIGSYISFEADSNIKKGFIEGKALDNRIGCFALIELAKRLKKSKNEIYFVFTVQEEIGLYGAMTSAFEIKPDWAITVDVTEAKKDSSKSDMRIGKGPFITIKNADFIGNRCINNWVKDIAKRRKIQLQYNVSDTETTDATNISLSRGGVPSSVVGVATENLHTAKGKAGIKDIKDAIEILYELMKNPPKVCLV
ncbi:M20/M25/M40 family metallo-hydrolase [Candidatus Woesearchaeota archaeon]|nr:M20/M25/M40 family metallo-hydrolase [Candidatus Woesearchaeota archaeon]